MAFNPSVRTENELIGEDRTWLATRKGWDTLRTVTLDVSEFTEAANLTGRVIRTGIVMAKITSTGLYGPYDPDAAGTGQETAAGFLFTSVELDNDDVALASNVGTAMLWEGIVVEANLPAVGAAEGMVDAPARVDLPTIRFE